LADNAYAPTIRNSTPSSMNADNMSLKSGFSMFTFSLEGPGVQCELPHHGEPVLRLQVGDVASPTIGGLMEDANA
jgi:hypothetical protein